MADSRFHQRSSPLRLHDIAKHAGVSLPEGADSKALFSDVAALQEAGRDQISFLDNSKYADAFVASQAGACFVREKFASRAPSSMMPLISDDPYRAYAKTASLFYPAPASLGISPNAHISDSARIGEGTQIDAGAFIGDGVEVGAHCRIGANCVITHSLIGDRVTIHPNCSIGQDGFGYAMSAAGHLKVPQLGRVIIGDHVEIGAGTCIDRGAGPDTIIGEGSKIDNLVQIGHNVKIGRGVIVVSQVGISGSTEIGDFAVLGGQVGVAGHLQIGAGAQIAAQSGVAQSLEGAKAYGGSPCVPIRDWHRQTHTLNEMVKNKAKTLSKRSDA